MRRLLTILTLILCTALPAGAMTIAERIAAELQAQGYEIIEAKRTWLGRLRIVAENDETRRELVLNPGTGEILRDYSVMLTALEQRERSQKQTPKASTAAVPDAVSLAVPDEVADAARGSFAEGLTVDEAAPEPEPEQELGVTATPLPDVAEEWLVPLLPDPLMPPASPAESP